VGVEGVSHKGFKISYWKPHISDRDRTGRLPSDMNGSKLARAPWVKFSQDIPAHPRSVKQHVSNCAAHINRSLGSEFVPPCRARSLKVGLWPR